MLRMPCRAVRSRGSYSLYVLFAISIYLLYSIYGILINAAAIALLLNALRQQQAKGGKLHLRNVPDSIRVLAQLYELAPLLGLTRTDTP